MVLGTICHVHDAGSSLAVPDMLCMGQLEDLTVHKGGPAHRPSTDQAGSKIAYLQSRHGSIKVHSATRQVGQAVLPARQVLSIYGDGLLLQV